MDLIKEFNHFAGSSIGEHKEQFCRYFKKLCGLDTAARLLVLNGLQAATRQEEIFITKIFLQFQHKDRLLQIVFKGDRILNKLIFSYRPYQFVDCSPEFYTNELFPKVSYVIRNRCIKNIANSLDNEHVAEELFGKISLKYGMKASCPLLLACSEQFTCNILKNYFYRFSERQLMRLHQRFGKTFLHLYYNELVKYSKPFEFSNQPQLATYLSVNDPEAFNMMLHFGKPPIGKRGFSKVVPFVKGDIIANPSEFKYINHIRVIYKQLNAAEFREFFRNLLLSSMKRHNYNSTRIMFKYLSLVPPKQRCELIASAYKENCGTEIWSALTKTHLEPLWQVLPKEDRAKFTIDDCHYELQPVAKAFPKLRKKIDLTSEMHARTDLVSDMLICARYNDDENALLDVLKFVCHRLKNDPSDILSNVLSFMQSNYKLDEMNAEIWNCLTEITLTDELNRKITRIDMLTSWMSYKFTRGEDVTEEFQRFVKYYGCNNFMLPSKDRNLQKWAVVKYPEVATRLFANAEKQSGKGYQHAYLALLRRWNKENPKDTISYYQFPEFVDYVFRNHADSCDDLLPNCIMIYATNDENERKQQNALLAHFDKFIRHKRLWHWMLENRLRMLEQFIHLIFDDYSPIDRKLCYKMHLLSFTALPERITRQAIEILNWPQKRASDNIGIVKHALLWMSLRPNFINHIRNYLPSGEATINVRKADTRHLVSVQERILDLMKNRVEMASIIDPVLQFCYKDYLQRALPTLTMALFHCPEGLVSNPIGVLETRSVTVRKRAIYFASTLLSVDKTGAFLKRIGSVETNRSLQKFIFQRTFHAFVDSCNEELWNILMDHFKFIDEDDTESIRLALMFQSIPCAYLGRYLAKVWNDIGKKWKNQSHPVLNAINVHIMQLLPDALCDDIIQFSLAASGLITTSNVDFIYRYLLHSGEKLNHRFAIVANNTRLVTDETTQLSFTDYNKKAKKIAFVFEEICERLISSDSDDIRAKKSLASKLHEAFESIPLPYNRVEYQLRIAVCESVLEHGCFHPQSIVDLQKNFLQSNGELMFAYFNKFIQSQFHLISIREEEVRAFICQLMDVDCSTHIKLLALELLPNEYPRHEQLAAEFRNILRRIEVDATPIVMCHLNNFMKNVEYC